MYRRRPQEGWGPRGLAGGAGGRGRGGGAGTTRGARNRRLLLAGIVVAIALSIGLAAMQWVVLKMLPFDNKSEFQAVVDMPAGTPVENTASVIREMGAESDPVPGVPDSVS